MLCEKTQKFFSQDIKNESVELQQAYFSLIVSKLNSFIFSSEKSTFCNKPSLLKFNKEGSFFYFSDCIYKYTLILEFFRIKCIINIINIYFLNHIIKKTLLIIGYLL